MMSLETFWGCMAWVGLVLLCILLLGIVFDCLGGGDSFGSGLGW